MRRVLTPAHATFSAVNRTISFATTVPASISHILKVANLTRGVVLFDPTAESGDGYLSSATYASPVLTLVVSTAGMADSDKLFIEYDDGQSGGGGGGGGGEVTVLGEVEIKNDVGNPIPTSVPVRTPTTTSVASSATSVTLLAANANRRGLSIANDSTGTLRLSFATPATSANAFLVLQPGAFILLDQQLIVTNIIYGIWSAANGTAQVTEYV
jgi:hypothetical protein